MTGPAAKESSHMIHPPLKPGISGISRGAARSAALLVLILCPAARVDARNAERSGGDSPPDKTQIWARFIDSTGQPIAGVEVEQNVRGRRETIGTSSADGTLLAEIDWTWPGDMRPWTGVAEHFGHATVPLQTRLVRGFEVDLGNITLEPGGAVSGRLTGADGRGLADAIVRVVPSHEADEPLSRALTFGYTRADGSYRVVGLKPGSYRVWGKHESTRWRKVENVHVEAGQEVADVQLKLEYLPDEYRIEGTVLDPEGRPVANADLRTSIPDPDGSGTLTSKAVSDAQGRFLLYLSELPSDAFWIEVRDPADRWSDLLFEGAAAGDRDRVLRFPAPLALPLTVQDDTGAPIEEFGWSLKIARGQQTKLEEIAPARHIRGEARVRVPSTSFRLEVRSRLHVPKTLGPFDPAALPATLGVRLDRLPCVTGRVTHAGKPVPNANVALVRPAHDPLSALDPDVVSGRYSPVADAWAITDAQGNFAIAFKQRGADVHVRASAAGLCDSVVGPTKSGGPGVAIELGSGGAIEGSLVLPDGTDPAGVAIEVYRDANSPRFRRPIDAARKWSCEHLAPGAWLVNVVYTPLRSSQGRKAAVPLGLSKDPPYVVQVTDGATTRCDLDFKRAPVCRISGTLTVAGKAPGKGTATLFSQASPALELSSSSTDADGRFTLAAREPGAYRIVWRGEASRDSKNNAVIERVAIVAGENSWVRDVTEEQWRVYGIDLSAK